TLSFAPHRYQRRTSERARAIEYWPGTTPPTRVGPPTCEFTRYVRPRVATSGARSPRPWPSGSACARRGQSGPPAGPTPSSEPDPHTTRDWDRRRSRRWPGNYEKLASRGCPSLRMKPTLDKSYSPCSEGYSRVPTRSMELFPWWIQAEAVVATGLDPRRTFEQRARAQPNAHDSRPYCRTAQAGPKADSPSRRLLGRQVALLDTVVVRQRRSGDGRSSCSFRVR